MATNPPLASTITGKFQIEVFGADLCGQQFVEQTRTLTITRDGAIIALTNKLAPDSELIIRNPATGEEAIARVVGLIRDAVFVKVYGIAFVDPSVNLWQVEYPEAEFEKTAVLECVRCHAVDAIRLNDIEMKVLESARTLSRLCQCSTSSTTWKRADRRRPERRAAEREGNDVRRIIAPNDELPTRVLEEKRREKRTVLKVPACVRSDGRADFVECEDVSRGGFRFKSRRAYPVRKAIEAAAPYARNSVNIFVAARIAYQQKLSGGFYRHGVEYVKSTKFPASKS